MHWTAARGTRVFNVDRWKRGALVRLLREISAKILSRTAYLAVLEEEKVIAHIIVRE